MLSIDVSYLLGEYTSWQVFPHQRWIKVITWAPGVDNYLTIVSGNWERVTGIAFC